MEPPPRPARFTIRQVRIALAALLISLGAAQGDNSRLGVATSNLGDHLVDAAGYSLYLFWPDARQISTCRGTCAINWPPFTAESSNALPAISEVLSPELLGLIEREDGEVQVSYNGWPLYYYAGDSEPGLIHGHMATEEWYLVTPAGEPLGL